MVNGEVSRGCPACGAEMQPIEVPYAPGRPMEVDTCEPCRALWFDTGEHIRLSAEGALAVIRHLAAAPRAPRGRFGPRLSCPVCRHALAETFDLAGGTQYRYFRCGNKHGVFIPVFDFLRSRGVVRGLSPLELEALRGQLGTVACPGCGAPVALDREAACAYCGAAVSIVDTEHLTDALRHLQQEAAAASSSPAGPSMPPEDVVAGWRASRASGTGDETRPLPGRRQPVDLLDLGVAAVSWLFTRR